MKNIFLLVLLTVAFNTSAQSPEANYDESKVPDYTLPDPLHFLDGTSVKNTKDWETRRKQIFGVFEREVYGIAPEWTGKVKISILSEKKPVFNGMATRKEIMLTLSNQNKILRVPLLIYLPRARGKAPVFLGYNFYGNQTITAEKDIFISPSWVRNNPEYGITDHKGTESSRGTRTSRWPLKEILSRGFGIVTLYYGDIDPDYDDGFKNGVHGLFNQRPDSTSWGSIAAWAWGLSRVMDYLETDNDINAKEVIVIGHSRLGKTALWAGASDKRFAIVISNDSGCGGAALSKRIFGETVGTINRAFPHWFCDNFNKYNENEQALPVDQHELIALIAPRPVYVASASKDLWADPLGEFLGAKNAEPVYQLFGLPGLGVDTMPPVNKSVGSFIGYHVRTGKHDITAYDWKQYLNFAEKHFSGKIK